MKEEYCPTQCLARTALNAVVRLRIRLVNQRPFTHLSERAALNDVSAGWIEAGDVPFACARCSATNSIKMVFDAVAGFWESACDVCATKVVRTAEKRVA